MRISAWVRMICASAMILVVAIAVHPALASGAQGSPVSSPETATDPPGCEGLTAYAASVLQLASENWQSVQEEIGLADPELAVFLGPEDFSLRLQAASRPSIPLPLPLSGTSFRSTGRSC